jgi:tetratricopeptide (TPR) repeat protein
MYGISQKFFVTVGLLLLLGFGVPAGARQDSPASRNLRQNTSSQRADRLAEARAALQQGKPEQAIEILESLLSDDPENPAALATLGETFLHQGQFDKAEPVLARAASATPGDAGVRIEWAVALARLHRYAEAEKALAGVAPPTAAEQRIAFHRLKASVALGLGNPTSAASEMEKALALRPQDLSITMAAAAAELQAQNWRRVVSLAQPAFSRTRDAQFGLALLRAQLAMHAEFQRTLEELRNLQLPADQEFVLRQQTAELLVSHGEFASSIEDLKRASEIEPGHADLVFNLALAEYKAGRLDDALASAEKCQQTGDTADLEDLLGDIEEARGDNLAAVRSYEAAVALGPSEERYRLSLAMEFIRHKNFDASKLVLRQAEELWPKSWRVQLALGMVEYFVGSNEQATHILLHASELAPEPETVLRYVADIQMVQAATPVAAAIAQVCGYADRHSTDAPMQFYCGALLFRRDYALGDKTHAGEIIERLRVASKSTSNDASPHCQLGRVYRWVERWPDALQESQICVRLDPDSADGHYRLAQIFQHLGQPEKFKQQMDLYERASKRVEDENARRDATMKTFLYTIQKEAASKN